MLSVLVLSRIFSGSPLILLCERKSGGRTVSASPCASSPSLYAGCHSDGGFVWSSTYVAWISKWSSYHSRRILNGTGESTVRVSTVTPDRAVASRADRLRAVI